MYKNFVKYLVFILAIMFTTSGCGQTISNMTNGQENNSYEAEKASQLQSNNNSNIQVENNKSQSKENEVVSQNIDTKSEIANDSNPSPVEVKKDSKVIVIDPGHGGKSGYEKEKVSPDSNELKLKNVSGATGIKSKTPEYIITLQVSQKLKEFLVKEGYNVIMTRTDASQTISNIERAEIGNKNNADLVIRVHADSSTSSKVKGASMLVPGQVGYAKNIATISRKYGEIIFKTLVDEVKMENRGLVTRNDLTGFNWSKVPVVLVEMGFLSNPDEDNSLNLSEYQNKIAMGLAKGIDNVFISK